MQINSQQQRQLIRWLKQQSTPFRKQIRLSIVLGWVCAILMLMQSWLLADILHQRITTQSKLHAEYILFIVILVLRALMICLRERMNCKVGCAVKGVIRQKLLDHLESKSPLVIKEQATGSWSTLMFEQVESLHGYFANYLPHSSLVMLIPPTILLVIFPINWIAGTILLITAPLIPLFMILVGWQASDANRRNFQALSRLSSHFLDRLRGMQTLRLFNYGIPTLQEIKSVCLQWRQHTIAVLRLAFVSCAVLEFFTALSIALIAIYFGFSYLGALNLGKYHIGVTLFSGLLILILAPEFYQPLRELAGFYHTKSQAIAAAQSISSILLSESSICINSNCCLSFGSVQIKAEALEIYSPKGLHLVGPCNFIIEKGEQVSIVGCSGAGKSTLFNALLGFLPYKGSLKVNGVELRDISSPSWHQHVSFIDQNPQLLTGTLLDNIILGAPNANMKQVMAAAERAYVTTFLHQLPQGLLTAISNGGHELSIGQAQRIIVARALLRQCDLLLLDEPTSSLDRLSKTQIMQALNYASKQQTTIAITHHFQTLQHSHQIWIMQNGLLTHQGSYQTLCTPSGPLQSLYKYHVSQKINIGMPEVE